MFKRYYIEVRDPSDELKDFYLYDNYGEFIRALRSTLNSDRSGFWRPKASQGYSRIVTEVTFHKDHSYVGNEFGEYVPNEAQEFLGLTAKLLSLLTLTDYEISELSKRVPRPIVDAAKELEIQRMKKGYFWGLLETYWSRYRHLYLALAAWAVASVTGAYFLECQFELRDSFAASCTAAIGTLTIGACVYRHFMSWTPTLWLSGIGALLLFVTIEGGGHSYCCKIIGPACI